MDRRYFLRLSGAGSVSFIGGCVGAPAPNPRRDEEVSANQTDTDRGNSVLPEQGEPSSICEENIRYDPGIYPIVEPAFGEDWSEVPANSVYTPDRSAGLPGRATVVGVEHGDVKRAYPVAVLTRHEIINDRIGESSTVGNSNRRGLPLLVTYCPLCRSGLVAQRVVGGSVTRFFVSGLLWEPPQREGAISKSDAVFGATESDGEEVSISRTGNLVMYDEATKSFWSQLLAKAICGPERGSNLSIVPSSITTWETWRSSHPRGKVLLPPPVSETTRG